MTDDPTITIPLSEYSNLNRIARAASDLESYLHANSGTNDDWPIDIIARDDVAAELVVAMLNNLRCALGHWRTENPQEQI